MNDTEALTAQMAALYCVLRVLVKTHPEPELLRAVVEANSDLVLATHLAGAPEDARTHYRKFIQGLLRDH